MAFKMKGSPHKHGTIEGTSSYFERILNAFRSKKQEYDPGFTINLTKEQEEAAKKQDQGFSIKLTKKQEEKAKNYDKGFFIS